MKRILIISLFQVLVSQSCSKTVSYYEGYIYNEEKKPLIGITVYKKYNKKEFTSTDHNGFFRIKKDKESIDLLIIEKDKNIIDSIQTVRTSGGERVNCYFIEGRRDTAFIKIQ